MEQGAGLTLELCLYKFRGVKLGMIIFIAKELSQIKDIHSNEIQTYPSQFYF